MGLIGGELGYRLLREISPTGPSGMGGGAYKGKSKLEVLLGREVWIQTANKVVIDFGCGAGSEAIELAQRGSRMVYGLDISNKWLAVARQNAKQSHCDNVVFDSTLPETADVIISIDAFEHFGDPAAILREMAKMLKPEGCALVSFGPTWYHPLGGHLFSVFPWAHVIFTETALCRWRSHVRSDGARRFSEVEGGLNQMTIGRFEKLVGDSPFRIESLEAVPIRKTKWLHNRITRELLTAIVRCKLRKKAS